MTFVWILASLAGIWLGVLGLFVWFMHEHPPGRYHPDDTTHLELEHENH